MGLGDESSSESDNNQENELCIEPQSNTVQFLKIYPKKFPDLSKSETSKARMKSNEDRYFHEKTYLELIKIVKEPF